MKVENFRPNLLVDGPLLSAHWEDRLSRLSVSSSLSFEVTGPCARCLMVNVDTSSGKMDCKVLEALKTYRYADRSVYFGQFLAKRMGDRREMEMAEAVAEDRDFAHLPRLHVGTVFLEVSFHEE